MNEITYQKSYQEYKEELKTELNRTVESFVRIGYLLKVARDTDILKQSEYDNVVDFAKAEYGIDKTQVSRFIHINDKFSEGGYADHRRCIAAEKGGRYAVQGTAGRVEVGKHGGIGLDVPEGIEGSIRNQHDS